MDNKKEKRYFGRYEIIEEIGCGGMGEVYKAYDPQLARFIALKFLNFEKSLKKEHKKRFLREAQVTAKLHHPNIVAIHDIGEKDGQLFFTMDYIGGVSLKKFIKENSLNVTEVTNIITKIGGAVYYAHQEGIIHRDLKPANVMISKNMEPVVLDFGLAKIVEDSSSFTKSGMIIGTLQYMPPEQADGKSEAIDERSDVYALGAILYELLTGKPPFGGSSTFSILNKILNQKPDFPPQIKYGSKKLKKVCLKALEKQKALRYQSAYAFIEAVNGPFSNKKNLPRKKFLGVLFLWTIVFIFVSITLYIVTKPIYPQQAPIEEALIRVRWKKNTHPQQPNTGRLIVDIDKQVHFVLFWSDKTQRAKLTCPHPDVSMPKFPKYGEYKLPRFDEFFGLDGVGENKIYAFYSSKYLPSPHKKRKFYTDIISSLPKKLENIAYFRCGNEVFLYYLKFH